MRVQLQSNRFCVPSLRAAACCWRFRALVWDAGARGGNLICNADRNSGQQGGCAVQFADLPPAALVIEMCETASRSPAGAGKGLQGGFWGLCRRAGAAMGRTVTQASPTKPATAAQPQAHGSCACSLRLAAHCTSFRIFGPHTTFPPFPVRAWGSHHPCGPRRVRVHTLPHPNNTCAVRDPTPPHRRSSSPLRMSWQQPTRCSTTCRLASPWHPPRACGPASTSWRASATCVTRAAACWCCLGTSSGKRVRSCRADSVCCCVCGCGGGSFRTTYSRR